MLVIVWSAAIVLLTLVWLAVRTPWGRVLRAIREDEDAAASLGKNVTAGVGKSSAVPRESDPRRELQLHVARLPSDAAASSSSRIARSTRPRASGPQARRA